MQRTPVTGRKRKVEQQQEQEVPPPPPQQTVSPKTPNRGQYGCVYWPSLVMDGGKVRTDQSIEAEEFVSKLQYDSAAARSEVTIGALVAPLVELAAAAKKNKKASSSSSSSKKKKFTAPRFAPVIEAFVVKRAHISDKVMRKCAAVLTTEAPPGASSDTFLVTKMLAAGRVTMDRHLRDFGATHLHLQTIWDELTISLDQLLTVGVVHRDLKGDNIMHGGTSVVPFEPTIIDFGLAMHVPPLLDEGVSTEVAAERWREAFPELVTDYVVWCPEITLCAALWQLSPLYDGDNLDFDDDDDEASSSSSSVDDSSSSSSSMTDESYWRHYEQDGQPLPPDEVVDARTVRRLRAVIVACFKKHSVLQALARRRPAEIAAKRDRLLALASACAGQSRLAAARHVLRETWHSWDRFSLAGAFLRYRPTDDDEDLEGYTEEYQNDLLILGEKSAKDFKKLLRHTRALWSEVDRLVLL